MGGITQSFLCLQKQTSFVFSAFYMAQTQIFEQRTAKPHIYLKKGTKLKKALDVVL